MTMRSLAFALSLLLAPTSAMATNWLQTAKEDIADSYIDLDSIKHINGYKRAWLKVDYHKDKISDYVLVLIEFDCDQERSRVLTIISYDSSGNHESINQRTEWQFVVPDSRGASDMKFVCGTNS